MNNYKPKIVVLRCNFCLSPGADEALTSKIKDNPASSIINTVCTGRIDPTFILDAFTKGADGVMVVGDAPGNCHFIRGNYKAKRNIMVLHNVLSEMGIEPDRLKAEWVDSSEVPQLLKSYDVFVEKMTALGPLTLN